MESKTQRQPGFKGEFLWELEFPCYQLIELAEAIPAERYGWRPAERVRSISEVFVHIAAGNFLLLDMVAALPAPKDLYTGVEGDGIERFYNLIARNELLEKTITSKEDVVRLLQRSLNSVRECFERATEAELGRTGIFFGEQSTVRRVYLRILVHTNEHMGQLIAYTRTMGMQAPWPAWRRPNDP